MTQFDNDTLRHLEKLCRIQCTPDEEVEILNSLNRVLSYVELLNEVDTKGVKPCNYVLRGILKNQMRSDEVEETMTRDQFLSNAPDQVGGMIRVPPILKPS